MSGSWTFVLTDPTGNALGELSTAAGRSVTLKRNSYLETTLTISHEDDAASLLLGTLSGTGVPRLKGYRRGPNDDPTAPATLRFRGPLVGLQEVSEESSLLTATFRSPFGVLLGDGDKTGRFVAPTGSLISSSALPSSVTNDASVGTVAWSITPGSGSGAFLAASAQTEYLKNTSLGFGIPSNAFIEGIAVTVTRGTGTVVNDAAVKIVKGGVIQTSDRSGPQWGITGGGSETVTYGSSVDLWGSTWTPADINNSGFGVALSAVASAGGSAVVTIFSVTITVYYSFGVVGDLYFAASDAGGIAKTLIDLTNADGATRLATDPARIAATVLRDRTFPIGQNIGAAIQDLTAVLDGFDFFETFVDGVGTTEAYFNVVASQGIVNSNAIFEYGPTTLNNVAHMDRTTQPPQNSILVTGGNGLSSVYIDTASVAKYGQWWGRADFSTIVDQESLDAKARALVRPNPVKTITLVPELGLDNCPKPFDDWNMGDTVTFHASRGALSESVQLRVNGFTVPIDDNGFESVSVDNPTSPEEDDITAANLIAEVLAE